MSDDYVRGNLSLGGIRDRVVPFFNSFSYLLKRAIEDPFGESDNEHHAQTFFEATKDQSLHAYMDNFRIQHKGKEWKPRHFFKLVESLPHHYDSKFVASQYFQLKDKIDAYNNNV